MLMANAFTTSHSYCLDPVKKNVILLLAFLPSSIYFLPAPSLSPHLTCPPLRPPLWATTLRIQTPLQHAATPVDAKDDPKGV